MGDSARHSLCYIVVYWSTVCWTACPHWCAEINKLRSIHSRLFSFCLCLLCLCSLQLTAVRRSMQGMKSFKSITRLWWVSYCACVLPVCSKYIFLCLFRWSSIDFVCVLSALISNWNDWDQLLVKGPFPLFFILCINTYNWRIWSIDAKTIFCMFLILI